MSSLLLLRFLSVFALIFLSMAVANPVEYRAWDAFSISPSGDDGFETSNPVAAKIWAQTPDNIDNSLAKPVDGSDPSNCSGERTKDLSEGQAGPGMCQNNYQIDREAGEVPVINNPTVAKPVDDTDMLFSDPLKSPTDDEKVCAKAPGSASHPVCAWIEWIVEGTVVSSSLDLEFCRPCKLFLLNADNSKKSGKGKKIPEMRLRIHLGYTSTNKDRLNTIDIFYTPCTGNEHLWCCAQVLPKVSTYLLI